MKAFLTYEMSSKSVVLNLYLRSDDREEKEYLSSRFNLKDRGFVIAYDVISFDNIEEIKERISRWVETVNQIRYEFQELQRKKEKIRELLKNQYHFIVEEE